MSAIAIEDGLRVVVLLPCRNVAATIGEVVRGFAAALPGAGIYVFDNNSTDDTARAASLAGARVFRESRSGRENVVRRMFADIDADIYLMAAGDGSCDPSDAPSLVNALVTERVDMVIGSRPEDGGRRPQVFGNRHLSRLHTGLFGRGLGDIRSRYRALTRRFVKSFPAVSSGLGIEAEMSVHASQLMIPFAQIPLTDAPAPSDASAAKMTGLPALRTIAMLLQEMRPFAFYAGFAVASWAVGLLIMAPILLESLSSGVAPEIPLTVLATGCFIVGFLLAGCGLVLESLGRSRVEHKRVLFLAAPALGTQ